MVSLGMPHVDHLRDTRRLMQVAQIGREVRVIGDQAQILFEMSGMGGVEVHQGGEKASVGLCLRVVRIIVVRAGADLIECLVEHADDLG